MLKTVGLIFGGYSAEHDVSIMSADMVVKAIDRTKYDVRLIGFDKNQQVFLFDQLNSKDSAELFATGKPISLAELATFLKNEIDVVFPLIHGPGGEDGKLQGFLKTLNIPFVGPDVTASAVCMDKRLAKHIMQNAGLPVVPSLSFTKLAFQDNSAAIIEQIEESLVYPVFVKPSNLGSSIGISKVKQRSQLTEALNLAFSYDQHVVVEQGIDPRELECAVFGNKKPRAMAVGEIIPSHETYDYEAKYSDTALSELIIPAPVDREITENIKQLALEVYQLLGVEGMARVDFLMDKSDDKIYLNELNTIPGFTKYSMFPLLCNEAGLSNQALISELIDLAFERYQDEQYYITR